MFKFEFHHTERSGLAKGDVVLFSMLDDGISFGEVAFVQVL